MSMTGSMCVSMIGRPTQAQIMNEQRRNSYDYIRVANKIKEGANANERRSISDYQRI